MIQIVTTLAITLLFAAGCGGGNTTDKSTSSDSTYIAKSIDNRSKESYGHLANATVNIYQLDGGEKKLLFSEKTSDGDDLSDIGNFPNHYASLRPGTYYQLEVFGGENWDTDKDGIKDASATKNTKHYRAIYKGHKLHTSWWQTTTTGIIVGGEKEEY